MGALGTTHPRLLDCVHTVCPLTLAHSQRVIEPLVDGVPNQKIFLPSWLGDFFFFFFWKKAGAPSFSLASRVLRTPLPPPPSLLQTLPSDPLFPGMLALL